MHLIFQQYDERLVRREAKPNTLRNFRRTSALFDEGGLDPLTAEDWQIEEWLQGLQLSPRTRRLHFENLAAAYNYAVHRRLLQQAPTETVRLPREPDREPRILETHELRHVLGNTMTEQQELLALTLIYTGMRRMEVQQLKWDDISPDSIRVIGKGDKLRHVPLHPALAEAIVVHSQPTSPYVFPASYGRSGPISQSALVATLEKVRGNVLCSFHDFRRTVATSLAENEVPEGIIDRIMGWAPRTVGRRYYIRRADSRMQEAILKLYADEPLTASGR
jgi:integrase/recombinase XerD